VSDSAEDRIHVATPARQQQARREGDVPKSFELAAAVQMIGAITVAYLFLGQIGQWMQAWTTQTWSSAGANLSVEASDVTAQIQTAIFLSIRVIGPMMVLLMLVGIASHWLQTGPLFVSDRVIPDPTRLASGNWNRQIFSLGNLALLVVGIPKTLIAFGVLVSSSWIHRNDFFMLSNGPADSMVGMMFSLILTITFHVAFALLITSAADYWLKLASYQRRIRMTDQQLRDELRMQNGDPQIRARRRQLNRVS
jgi:flagellar biosynthesis protein FlhB